MGWHRSHRRFWSIAALLALTLQIALSFGHGHGGDTHPAVAANIAAAGGNGSAPTQPDGTDHDEHYCPTCAILALLTGAQTADAPSVAPPAVPAAAQIVFVSDTVRLSTSPASFRSRAPPLS